jgi:hypothetical protein
MAVSSVVISVEGVLQKTVSSSPIPVGVALYHGLSSVFNVLLISESDKKQLDYWLYLEALNKHSAVEYNENVRTFMTEEQRKFHQLNSLRVRKYSIDLVIEPNPLAASLFLQNGFNVMTFTHAQYAMPQWRPDYEERIKPWQEIEDYEVSMAKLRAIDARLKTDKENL